MQRKVAARAVDAFAQLARKNNITIVAGNMSGVSALAAAAMALMRGPAAAPGQRPGGLLR